MIHNTNVTAVAATPLEHKNWIFPSNFASNSQSSAIFDAFLVIEWHIGLTAEPLPNRDSTSLLQRMCVLGGVVDAISGEGYTADQITPDCHGSSSMGINCQLLLNPEEEFNRSFIRKPQTLRIAWCSANAKRILKPTRQALAVITGPGAGIRLSNSMERWHSLRQELALNRPGKADGILRMWMDGLPVLDTGPTLNLRSTDERFITCVSLRIFPVGSVTNLKHAPLSQIANLSSVRSYLPRTAELTPLTEPLQKNIAMISPHEPSSFMVSVGLVRLDTHGV
jgi:hypothetical protein